jgi:hypothetical protein
MQLDYIIHVKYSVFHRQCLTSFHHQARLNHQEYGRHRYPLQLLKVELILRTSADCQHCSSSSRAIQGIVLCNQHASLGVPFEGDRARER